MKRVSLVLCATLVLASVVLAQIPNVTIRQIQLVPFDSLLLADALQNTNPARWTLQRAPAPYYNDTVTVTAVCVVPAKILTFTAGGFTMLLYDTATVNNWGAIFVRCNAPADTAQNILDGFLNVERGDLITITGIITDFPLTSMNSATQFQPVAGRPITILGTAPVPGYRRMQLGDFYQGTFPGGSVRYSTGEPYEATLVEFVNLTVDARVNLGRGTFSAVDEFGNQITMYDASRYFTLGHGGTTPFPADTHWARVWPTVGTRIDTLRGYITTVSATENPRGYRLAPIFRNDVAIGIVLPSITTHRRNPIVVSPDSAARITARVTRQTGGFPITGVTLKYSINNGPFIDNAMTFISPDTAGASIPAQPANTFVHYFVQAQDSAGNVSILASSAFLGAATDTSKGFFFYTVLDRPLTIHDIQYTPYVNGRTPYLGAFVTVSGVVTADTPHVGASPLNTGGTNAWYMQTGSEPWNGLWFVGSDAALFDLRNGDSITVSGFVGEQFDVTRLSGVTSPITVHTTGSPEPAPAPASTGTFGPNVGNGTPAAEQHEGMLVRFTDVRVSSVDFNFNDDTEFEVTDGSSGPIVVRRDGTHHYSNRPADTSFGKTILHVGDRISSLTGIIYYSFNRYKIVPRTDADFGTITGVDIGSDPLTPQSYALEQNYPNPFNPSTTIEYSLPAGSHVSLRLYNILGQEVVTLVDQVQESGKYTLRYDATTLPTGVYFYRLQARSLSGAQGGEVTRVGKMMLLK